MKKIINKRLFSAALSILLLAMLLAPVAIQAEAVKAPPPAEPVEKIIYSNGGWNNSYTEYDGKTQLIVEYTGGREIDAEVIKDIWSAPPPIEFKLKDKTLLRGVYLPFTYPPNNPMKQQVEIWLVSGKGNVYGPYETIPLRFGGARAIENLQKEAADQDIMISVASEEETGYMMDNIFIAKEEIALPAGSYSLYTDDSGMLVRNQETGVTGAVLIKGIDYKIWKEYKEKLLQWEAESNPDIPQAEKEDDIYISVMGNEELKVIEENPESYSDLMTESTSNKLPALIKVDKPTLIDEIVFNTYNGGKGAAPGTISITGSDGKPFGTFKAHGGSLGNTPNGIWIASPGIVLEAGEYTVTLSDMSVAYYDSEGNPDFCAAVAPMRPQVFDFTGRYYIDFDALKISTLMGAVNPPTSALSLKQFELSVLDRGETIELVGKYEGMPFSQLCEITERTADSLKGNFNFSLNLKNLPYKAMVSANGAITLHKPSGLQPKLELQGSATYQRAESKDKGADFNTYSLTGVGSMASKDLPAYVVAALGTKIFSAGSIPGPDGPAQAAVGMLFPPLVGVVANVIQTLLKPKPEVEKHKLSVGEQAMADANNSLGKGLYDEKEAKAWATLADAMANTDEPDDDPYSVGDNEVPVESVTEASGEGNTDDAEESEDSYSSGEEGEVETPAPEKAFETEQEKLEAERDEWLEIIKNSRKSADPNDPRTKELEKEYENYVGSLNDRIETLKAASRPRETMTVQIDHTGRTAEIEYDPATDRWFNTESGNEFSMERYKKDVAPSFTKDKEFIEKQREKLEKGDTEFDRAMKALVEDQKQRAQMLGQLQKIRNESYGIIPPADGVGDVRANIDRLINDLGNRNLSTEELRDKAVRIAKVVTGRNTGRTISEEEGQRITDREMSYTKAAAVTVTEGWKDVITGRTWAGMAGRTMMAGLTGGASEYVMSPAEAMIDIKESMDQGESGVRATLKAMGKYALGEIGGEYMGEAWKRSGYSINPDFIKKVSDIGNTPVSKLLGTGGKAGSKEALEGISAKAGKTMLGSSDGNIGKSASDAMDYAKYKTQINKQASVIDAKIRSGEPLTPDEIRKVLRDPSIPRELKNSHPDIQNTYQDTLEKTLYGPANKNTSQQLEKDMLEDIQKEFGPDAKIKVEVDSIRTPGGKGSRINADNDLTGKITITDSNGKKIIRELPSEKVGKVYNEKFAETSGMIKDGKFNVDKAKAEMPEGITVTDANGKTRTIDWDKATQEQQLEAFAKKHNQEVTDIKSAEAAADFNALKNKSGASNVGQLKAGVSTARLDDPAGLAKMEQYKINNYFNKGGLANQTEAYEQLTKMGKLTNDLTGAYQKLGYSAKSMPDNMKKALEIAGNRNLSPGTRTLELQKLGFNGPGDLANKLSGRIEGLQKLGTPVNPSGGDSGSKALKTVTSILISSHLNESR